MKSRFITDPQDPFDGFFNSTWTEVYTSVAPAARHDGGSPLGNGPLEIPSTPALTAEAVQSSGAQTGPTTSFTATSGSGIIINLLFDTAAMAAPASFRAGIQQAASILAATISDKITVNIKIDYSGTGSGAAAGPDAGIFLNYSTVRTDLINNATPGDSTFNALPSGSSIQGQTNVAVWNAQLKLWGLLGANDTTTDDGSATFATDINSSLLVGVALHELTHAMGRIQYGSAPDIFDLFRFTSAGTRLFQGSATAPAAYFSVDGGNTKLADYGQTSDASDFLNSGVQGPNDPFNELYTGSTIQSLSAVDKQQLDALGFHTTSQSIAVSATASQAVQGGAAVTLLSGTPVIADTASTTLSSATIKVANAGGSVVTGDVLYVNGVQNGAVGNGVTASWNASTGTLTLTGSASLAVYDTLLSQVSYRDTGIDSSTGSHPLRTVTWTVNDSTSSFGTTSQIAIDRAPLETVANIVLGSNTVSASSLFSASDADGDIIATYAFKDTGNGHFLLNGVVQANNQEIDVTAAQLSQLTYQGVSGGVDSLQVRVNDGITWSTWQSFTVTGPTQSVAVTAAASEAVQGGAAVTLLSGQPTITRSASATLSSATIKIANTGGNAVAGDQLFVNGLQNGSVGNGVAASWNASTDTLTLTGSASLAVYDTLLSEVAYQDTGIDTSTGSHPLRTVTWSVNDGAANFSTTSQVAIDRAPVATIANMTLSTTSVAASSLLTTSDPDGDAITTYAFMDTGNGHFILNGVVQANNQEIDVMAAQLSQLTYQTTGGTDSLQVRLNDGTTWDAWQGFTVTGITTTVAGSVKDDFNGDGKSDLIWQNGTTFSEWQSTGSGFTPNVYTGAVSAGWTLAGIGDFNVDGKSDLLWFNSSTYQFSEWQSTGNGFTPNVYVNGVSAGWTLAGTADFNGDGRSDVLWFNSNTYQFTEWQSTGNGFAPNVYVNGVSAGWTLAGTGDFNGDGKSDLLWFNSNTYQFTEWQSNGNGFTPNVYISAVSSGWALAGTSDFNGDGKSDLLWFNSSTGQFSEWQSTGNGFTSNVYVNGVSAGWKLAGAGDYSGDGKSDLLWYNSSTGQFSEWQSNGNGFTPNVYVSGVSPGAALPAQAKQVTDTVSTAVSATAVQGNIAESDSIASHSAWVTAGGLGAENFNFKPGFGASDQFTLGAHGAHAGELQSLFRTAYDEHDTVVDHGNYDIFPVANLHVAEPHASSFILHP